MVLPDWLFRLGAGLFLVDLRVSVEFGVLESSVTRSSVSLVGTEATGGAFRLVAGNRGCGVDAASLRLRSPSSVADGFLSSDTVDSPLEVELGDLCWWRAGDSVPQIPAATLDALAFLAASFSRLCCCLRSFFLRRLHWAEDSLNSLASGSSDDVSPLGSRWGNSLVSLMLGAGEGAGLLCGVMCVGGSAG